MGNAGAESNFCQLSRASERLRGATVARLFVYRASFAVSRLFVNVPSFSFIACLVCSLTGPRFFFLLRVSFIRSLFHVCLFTEHRLLCFVWCLCFICFFAIVPLSRVSCVCLLLYFLCSVILSRLCLSCVLRLPRLLYLFASLRFHFLNILLMSLLY